MMSGTTTSNLCWMWRFCLCLALAASSTTASSTNATNRVIHLRAGIFSIPPYVYLTEEQNNLPLGVVLEKTEGMRGMALDLMDRLRIFAWERSQVDLQFSLMRAPYSYDKALSMIANDCETSIDVEEEKRLGEESLFSDLFEVQEEFDPCNTFDLIAADYYGTGYRSMRIDYSPPYLHGAISVAAFRKPVDSTDAVQVSPSGGTSAASVVTMAQADRDGSTICVLESTSTLRITREKYPGVEILECPTQLQCVVELKQQNCILYVEDSLQLKFMAQADPSLVVSLETFNPQYIYWILSEKLPASHRRELKQWMYFAIQNGTVNELYETYFEKEACPLGRTGANCDLPCDAQHGSDVGGVCVCRSVKWTGDDCSTQVPEETNLIPPSLKIVAYVLVGINAIVMIGCGVWLYIFRHSPQVQMAQPYFLVLVLVGCGISSSAIIAMAQEDEGDGPVHACMAIPWLYSVGFCITFGTLFAKIGRIYKIFKSSVAMRHVKVTFAESVQVIAAVLFLDVIILTIWTFVSPLEWRRQVISADQFGEPIESEGYCTSEYWAIFGGAIALLHVVLMLIASYLCYVARHIPTQFSEGKYLSVAMVSNLQIFVVGVPVLIVVGSEPETSFFVRSAVIWMNDLVVVLLIFGNLIKSVMQFEEQDAQKVKTQIRSAMNEFSRLEAMSDRGSQWEGSQAGDASSRFGLKTKSTERNSSSLNQMRNSDLESINSSWKKEHSSEFIPDLNREDGSSQIEMDDSDDDDVAFKPNSDLRYPNVHKMPVIESKSDISMRESTSTGSKTTSSILESKSDFDNSISGSFRVSGRVPSVSLAALRELETGELQEAIPEAEENVGSDEPETKEGQDGEDATIDSTDPERFVLDAIEEDE